MRLDKILPLPISTVSPARRDERATERPKPPDSEAGDEQSGEDQTGSSADNPDAESRGAPPGHIDITV